MYTIHNNVEEKVIFAGDTNEFLRFVDSIRIENEDHDFSILGESDAREYIEDYCGNLDMHIVPTDFIQVCVWPGTVVGEGNKKDFEDWAQEEFGVRVMYCEEIETLPTPGVEGTGGRNDLFFRVHTEDIGKFAVPRLAIGIRWWEDVLGNGDSVLYTEETLKKYPKTW
jgi:hypothetical protein